MKSTTPEHAPFLIVTVVHEKPSNDGKPIVQGAPQVFLFGPGAPKGLGDIGLIRKES
jgi:hypothetical protein